jgi:hypothetical protein
MNLNLAGSSYSSTLQNAVNYAWKKIVAAAANNRRCASGIPADAFYGAGNFLRALTEIRLGSQSVERGFERIMYRRERRRLFKRTQKVHCLLKPLYFAWAEPAQCVTCRTKKRVLLLTSRMVHR